jgi:hypothetical protein
MGITYLVGSESSGVSNPDVGLGHLILFWWRKKGSGVVGVGVRGHWEKKVGREFASLDPVGP